MLSIVLIFNISLTFQILGAIMVFFFSVAEI